MELLAWHWSKSRAAWESAWDEPALGLRFFYLVCGLGIALSYSHTRSVSWA